MKAKWSRVARRIRVPMGFAFAAMFLWRARPSRASLGWSLPVVLPGVLLRAYASGCVNKNAELTVTGPYAHTRNPLYLGSMLIAFGFAGSSHSKLIAVSLPILFTAIYFPVIRSEEQFLLQQFPEFFEYRRQVPKLLPRVTPAQLESGGEGFSPELYRKHREYNAALGTAAIYAVLLLGILWRRGVHKTKA